MLLLRAAVDERRVYILVRAYVANSVDVRSPHDNGPLITPSLALSAVKAGIMELLHGAFRAFSSLVEASGDVVARERQQWRTRRVRALPSAVARRETRAARSQIIPLTRAFILTASSSTSNA